MVINARCADFCLMLCADRRVALRAVGGTSVAPNLMEGVMTVRPAILCPIDYSDPSAAALRYAAAIAEHFITRLIVLSVEDPLLTAAMDLETGVPWTSQVSQKEIASFVAKVFAGDSRTLALCEYEAAVGKPAVEILRVARERSCDLIVMSSHGLTGARKLFFGSTTERVLRETNVPVLVTPSVNPGPVHIEEARQRLGRIVVPVDLSSASDYQTRIAGGLAEALSLPLVLLHVIEPVRSHLFARLNLRGLETNRRVAAEEALDKLVGILPSSVRPKTEALIVSGDPAEEAAKVIHDRQAGLVVMGLHGSPMLGPRMGSVTYRMLCLSPTLMLALPPHVTHHGTDHVMTPTVRSQAR
jgi:nucleotide-binding universal stress UspA family protein